MRNPWKLTTVLLAVALAAVVGRDATVSTAEAGEKQPHMKAALVSLRQAKNQLEKATHDKGGHRVKALELTNAAIEQVEKGIAFDNRK